MIAYRELEHPETPYSPASYRLVEMTEEQMSALILAKLSPAEVDPFQDWETGR